MSVITLTEAFAEIEALSRHLALKRNFLLALAARPGNLRDPLAGDGGSAEIAILEQQSLAELEEHHIAVRRAVRAAAQNTTITIGSQIRTIADWLEWRRKVAPGRRALFRSLQYRILSARLKAQEWLYTLPETHSSERALDIVVNIQEPELARQSELLEEALGSLDGQLSLKMATVTVEITSLSKFLHEQDRQIALRLQQMGQDSALTSTINFPNQLDDEYVIPEEYDAYSGYGMSSLPYLLEKQVRDLLSGGRKIEAIKLVRDKMGWSLLQSKQSVDALQ